jgi:3',5'-cyclic-AMP phosphodiesterase
LRILQLSDPHVRVPGDLLSDRVETLPYLEQAVLAVERLQPRPDLVLLTGDIVDTGTDEEYRYAREALERLTLPLLLLPGNHDDRAGCRKYLIRWMGEVGPGEWLAYVVDRFPLRIIALDSVIPRQGRGRLGEEQLRWLEAQLGGGPDRPTLLAMHHPPFEVGIGFMDQLGLIDRDDLSWLLGQHAQVVGVVSGHIHRTIVGRVGPVVALTAPSTAHQIPLDLTPDSAPTFVFEPPGFLLHEWDGSWLRSHHVYVGEYGPEYLFGSGEVVRSKK